MISAPLFTRMHTDDDDAWIADARRGDPAALERLFDTYHGSVYRLCYRLLGHQEDAQDAAQLAFIRAFRALSGFRGESSLKTWLYRIAVRESASYARSRKSGEPLEAAADRLVNGDASVCVGERAAIEAAMKRLKPDHRTALVLRYWEELSYEEIAGVLGISLSAVRMRLNRARQEFVSCYQAEENRP